MARTELPNGVILPAEYADDWYEDMTSNLTKLDDVIGSDSEKLNADGVNFLRMSSAALTDGGTGNFSDLNSSYKIKTGDLVLDSGRKLYQVVSVDATNETFTVGNSLFKVTAESDLAPVAESGDYDDLTDLPTYGITRFCSSAISDNSSVAFSAISSTNKIKVGDFLLDTVGKMYQISSVDTANETAAVTTPLTQLAVDRGVVHKSGDETISGVKSFINYFLGKDLSGQTVDLNDCVDAYSGAIHYYYAVSNYTNISNKPENKPFILESRTVRYVSSIDYTYYQKIYTADYNTAPSIYTRYYRSGSASWSNWIKDTDKFVTTDTAQTVSGAKTFSEDIVISNSDTSQTSKRLVIRSSKVNLGDNNSDSWGISFNAGSSYASMINSEKSPNCMQGLSLTVRTKDENNNLISANYRLRVYPDGSAYLIPSDSISLGSSSNKWKDTCTNLINGLEPSSLSLPSGNSSDFIDISGSFTNTGSGDTNTYAALANGWIYLRLGDISSCQATVYDANNNRMWGQSSTGSVEQITVPILKGQIFTTQWNTSSSVNVANAKFIPCQGNV